MQQIFSYISAHWMEGSIWLLGLGWGYLVKKVTEYKTIKDGLLAIMHDRLYQVCTLLHPAGLDRCQRPEEPRILIPKLPRAGRQWHRHRAL